MDMRQFRARNEIAFNDLVVIELVDRDLRVSQVQKHLQAAGVYNGAIDGVLGPQTREALRQYQARRGLPTTGELDEATRKALSSQ
jgi:peptidoglycan hydrolase-like protein with peptidoglycan-binding domain